jgi:hypothetical protein
MKWKGSVANIFILFCIVLICLRCTKDNSELYALNYGTSFNMCIGYCYHEMKLESGYVTYIHSSWVDSIETITCLDVLNDNTWKYFKTQLNVDDFFTLPKTTGCPDCADGGAEWIEIELVGGEKHKVTFEFGNEPGMLNDYVVKLREQMSKSVHCGEY